MSPYTEGDSELDGEYTGYALITVRRVVFRVPIEGYGENEAAAIQDALDGAETDFVNSPTRVIELHGVTIAETSGIESVEPEL
jgi:hypothetical protein